jgi:hypothetical protein
MKKVLVFVFLVGWTSLTFASDKDSTSLQRKNVVKFLPSNLLFQSLSFEYERMINAKNSFTLGIGLPQQQSLIGKYGIKAGNDLKAAELGTMHIRAAYRHYSGHRMLPKGFYIEPYVKYQKVTGSASVKNTGTNPFEGVFDMNINTLNFGFQLGAQFLIAKRVSLDFYFLGLEAGMISGNVSATSSIIGDASKVTNLKNEIENSIKDLPSFIGDKLTVTQPSSDKINVKASGVPYPWLRGGISIGIAF